MVDLIEELENEILKELQKFKQVPFIDKSIGLLEIIRSVDDIFCYYSYALPVDSPEKDQWYIYFKTHATGFYECFEQLCYDEEKVENSSLLYNSTDASKKWANYTLQQCGSAGYLTRYIQLAKHGLFSLEKKSPSRFVFRYKKASSGAELVETKFQNHLREFKIISALNNSRIKELDSLIPEEMEKRVNLWNTHFIKYDTSPLINEYYFLRANAVCQGFVGYDAFHEDSLFNGISYGTINRVLKSFVASSLKHFDFCQAALRKYTLKILNQWNLLTTPYKIDDLSKDISNETGVHIDIISWVLQILTLTKNNLKIHLNAPGSSLPPFIKIEKNWILRSITGLQSNPYTYLIRHLKHYYYPDYSTAVNLREEMFKKEFYSYFDNAAILKCDKNVKLKITRDALTDIDAMIFDTKENLLLLVQLKWMDDFGTSMWQRKSMADNFYSSTKKWLDKIDEYLKVKPSNELLNHFDKITPNTKIKSIHKLVLGRHFAHFSGQETDERATWCGWPQLVQLLNKNKFKRSLSKLLKEIEKQSLSKINLTSSFPDTTFELGHLAVVISFKNN